MDGGGLARFAALPARHLCTAAQGWKRRRDPSVDELRSLITEYDKYHAADELSRILARDPAAGLRRRTG